MFLPPYLEQEVIQTAKYNQLKIFILNIWPLFIIHNKYLTII